MNLNAYTKVYSFRSNCNLQTIYIICMSKQQKIWYIPKQHNRKYMNRCMSLFDLSLCTMTCTLLQVYLRGCLLELSRVQQLKTRLKTTWFLMNPRRKRWILEIISRKPGFGNSDIQSMCISYISLHPALCNILRRHISHIVWYGNLANVKIFRHHYFHLPYFAY